MFEFLFDPKKKLNSVPQFCILVNRKFQTFLSMSGINLKFKIMKKQLIHFLLGSSLILLTFAYTVAQAPDTLWTKTLADGVGYSVYPLEDGGFMIGGYTSVAGYRDFYMAKTDDEGDVIWEKTFGNNDRNESLAAMIKTSDGGYLLAGNRAEDPPYNSYADVYLVKTDAEGNQEWYSIFGQGGETESPGSVAQTLDGGYILCPAHFG